jgi:hypothetical protein
VRPFKSVVRALFLVLVSVLALGARFDPARPAGMAGGQADFTFAVITDVQEPPLFAANVGWLDTITADFYVIDGDHTPGYTDSPKQIALWNGFEVTANKLKSPYVMVPGNHDCYDAVSQDTWRKRYGPLWFSWNHRGCHFVVLDSIEIGSEGFIRGAQLEWLKKDLAAAKGARATFVFVHWPQWKPGYKDQAWFADVHPLLAAAGVDYVFAGHEHHYEVDDTKDGVRYIVLGPTAGNTGEDFGSFTNALLVEVKGAAATYRLLTPEGERRADFYTRAVELEAGRPIVIEPVTRIGKNRPVELAMTVGNPWKDRPVQVIASLNPGAGSWTAGRVERTLAAGERARIVLKTRTGATVMPLPTVSVEIRCEGERVVLKEVLPVITAKIPGLQERVVDDFQDGDDYNLAAKSGIALRGGRWVRSVDKYGESKLEMAFADGALHVSGVHGKSLPPNYTYTNFTSWLAGEAPVNLTGSTGISFRARSDRPGRWETGLELTVGGKNLSRTGRGHRVGFDPGKEWKEFRFFWHEFTQPDWVTAADRVSPMTVDAVEGISWNMSVDGAFDLWLDDVKLIYE